MDFSKNTGLIFDCDGTLADTMPLHLLAWQTSMQRHDIVFPESRFYAMAGQPTVKIIETLLCEQSLTGDAAAISDEKEDEFLKLLEQVKPIEAVVDIARRYRDTHPMGVGSGGNRDIVFKTLEIIGLQDFFDAVVGFEDTDRHKPEPDVFLEVARRIGADPIGCCVFEDADLGIEAARRAGMEPVDIRTW